jgi:ABC-type lipoprotein release transport system permease subunit
MVGLALLFNSRRPRARLLLSVIGIALGVALGYAVHLVNRAALADVTAAVRAVAGEADIEVRGGRTGFPDALYPAVARVPGVRTVSPVLELDVGLAGPEGEQAHARPVAPAAHEHRPVLGDQLGQLGVGPAAQHPPGDAEAVRDPVVEGGRDGCEGVGGHRRKVVRRLTICKLIVPKVGHGFV